MSYTQAFATLFFVAVGAVFLLWLLIRGWSPESLPQWAGIIWALIAAMLVVPKLLPGTIRWSDNTSIVTMFILGAAFILSIKAIFVFIRHYGSLSSTQRLSGYLAAAPLILSILGVVFTFWAMGGFHQTKK
ncbi:MAG: hypothetical protein IT270_05470 [Saprospiraceae bacterium]|nr:hypothetical protein [Saprospiraceae bacterium]